MLRFSAFLAVVTLAGCGVSATNPAALGPASAIPAVPLSTVRTASWMSPEAKQAPLVYISDYEQDSLTVFNATTGAVLGQIGGLSAAAGLFVDPQHRLWVANSGKADVLVFDRGSTTPSLTLSDPSERPFDVAVCPNGKVYVSNYYSFNTGLGSVSVYAKGSTSPTGSLADPNEFENYFIACDHRNNVFTTLVVASQAGQVDEFPGGNAPAKKLVTVDSGGGIAFDAAGNLVVSDPSGHVITEYTKQGVATGKSIKLGVAQLVFGIAVSRNGKKLLGANAGGSGLTFALWSGTPGTAYRANFTEPLGAAYDPAQKGL